MGRERRGQTSNRSELNGRSAYVDLGCSFAGIEIENCSLVQGEDATSGLVVVRVLVGCKGEVGVLSGESRLKGIFEGDDIG